MEPQATTTVWEGDRLTTYDATQFVFGQQRNVAAILGVSEDNVRVICPFIGGGFGSKPAVWTHSSLTAAAARALNRPIKTILTREQMFTLTGHANGSAGGVGETVVSSSSSTYRILPDRIAGAIDLSWGPLSAGQLHKQSASSRAASSEHLPPFVG